MPTFKQLRDNVKARASVSSESTYDTAINLWLNDGQRDILNRYLWDFARTYEDISTVAATGTYSLSNPGIVYNARNITSSIPMKYITDLDFDRLFPVQTASGTPRFFQMGGLTTTNSTTVPTFQFYPIPDGVYTVRMRYYQRFTDLVADGDVSKIPETYHELLVNYAANILFSSQGDTRSVEQYTKYESGILTMVDQLQAQPVAHVNILRSTDDEVSSDVVRFPANYGTISL